VYTDRRVVLVERARSVDVMVPQVQRRNAACHRSRRRRCPVDQKPTTRAVKLPVQRPAEFTVLHGNFPNIFFDFSQVTPGTALGFVCISYSGFPRGIYYLRQSEDSELAEV